MNIKVRNLRLGSVSAHEVTLQWDAPYSPHVGTELYDVKYYVKGHKVNTTRTNNLSLDTSITISGLQPSTEYCFMVSRTLLADSIIETCCCTVSLPKAELSKLTLLVFQYFLSITPHLQINLSCSVLCQFSLHCSHVQLIQIQTVQSCM